MTHQNIWAVGRNYARHAAEMKADIPTEPLFFLKAGSCLHLENKINLPAWSKEINYELELAFLIDENLNFSHLTLALDLTARDQQALAIKNGTPWTLSKSFKQSCPIATWIKLDEMENFKFYLEKNNQKVQQGSLNEMLFKPVQLLNYAKDHFPIIKNDILLTGTPEGVGPLQMGDKLNAKLFSELQNKEILNTNWIIE